MTNNKKPYLPTGEAKTKRKQSSILPFSFRLNENLNSIIKGGEIMGSFAVEAVAANVSKKEDSFDINKVDTKEEVDAILKELGKYLEYDEEKKVSFNEKKALKKGASTSILEIGRKLNTISAYNADKLIDNDSSDIQALGIPVHGNWCGPGHGGGGALDLLDGICRSHDKCYGSKGYFTCSCDDLLIKSIQYSLPFMATMKERTKALAVSAYFHIQPCIKR